MRPVQDVLENELGLDLTGWNLEGAYDISDDGTKIVGWGINPDGNLEAWLADLGQIIFVDWENPTSKKFVLYPISPLGWSVPIYVEQQADVVPGPDEFTRLLILSGIRSLFQGSGVFLPIWEYKGPARTDNGLFVRFHPPLGQFTMERPLCRLPSTGRLLGMAYDVSPPGFDVIDQFNRRRGGEVAVFNEEVFQNLNRLIKTISHEVGHGLGLRHINPLENNDIEVMDYEKADLLESFTAFPAQIVEPPFFGLPALCYTEEVTHNPVYHLKRYAMKQSADELETDGIVPGDWDVNAVRLLRVKLNLIQSTFNFFDGTALSISGAGLADNGSDAPPLAQFPTISPSEPLEWLVRVGTPFMFFASTEAGANSWNAFFTTDGSGPVINTAPGTISGTILAQLPGQTEISEVGQFSATVELVGEPEPPTRPFECVGFDSPIGSAPEVVNETKVFPLKANLLDETGSLVTDKAEVAIPVIYIEFENSSGTSTDVSAQALASGQGVNGSAGGQFEFRGGKWRYNLQTSSFSSSGTYVVTMASVDTSDYSIENTCRMSFVLP